MNKSKALIFLCIGLCLISPTLAFSEAPKPIFDVKNYGAIGNGTTNNTIAIQKAIDSCAGTGGSVYLHNGTFLSGMIKLKSDMTLYIDSTATLLGTTDITYYPTQILPTNNWNKQENGRGLIFSLGARNIKITGGGTINGNGKFPAWYGRSVGELERPIPIWCVQSKNVEISNLKIVDGAMWTIVPFETDSVIIRNVNINSNISANRDGIDIVDCHNVLIEGCTFNTEDDVICSKSGHIRGVVNVTVRNCTINGSTNANGIKFGTTSYGSFKNVLFEDITINNVSDAGIAIEAVDGSNIENVVFQRIKMKNVGSPFFIILADRGRTPAGDVRKAGTIKDIIFRDIVVTSCGTTIGCAISGTTKNGITYKPQNILFENININFMGGLTTAPSTPAEYSGQYPNSDMWGNLPAYGFYLRHVSGLTFKNCHFTANTADARPWLVCRDTSNIVFDNCIAKVLVKDAVINAETHVANSGFTLINNLTDGITSSESDDSIGEFTRKDAL